MCLVAVAPAITATAGSELLQSCSYFSRKGEWARHSHCVRTDTSGLHVLKQHVHRLHFDAYGLGSIMVERQYYYIRRDGRSLAVIAHDNGPDEFSEDLVRSKVGGKIGYFDRDFHQAIATTYDWGWPFENGKALVCEGCRIGDQEGDGNRPVIGGRWFRIDRNGIEVEAVNRP